LLGLSVRKRFFPNYERYPTAVIPKLSIRIKIMKMNTTTKDKESQLCKPNLI